MGHSGKSRQQLIAELQEAERLIARLQESKPATDAVRPAEPSADSRPLRGDRRSVQAEEELLRKSEGRYRAFVDQCVEGIWLIELETPISIDLPEDQQIEAFYRYGQLTKCNDAMAQMYGLTSAAQLQGTPLSDLLIPTDPHNQEHLRAFIRSGYRLVNAESHEVDAQGKPKYFSNNLMGIIENGYLTRAWGTQRDITETRLVDEALRDSESRFRTLAESASDAIITIDEASRILFANPAAEKIFGHALSEMLGQDLTMLMPEYLRHLHQQGFTRYKTTGQRHISWEASELPGRHKNGSEVPLQISFGEYAVNGQRLFTGIVRDISQARQVDEALRASEARQRALLQAVPDWMFRFRSDGTYLDFSGPIALGLLSTPDIFLGKTLFEVHDEEFARQALQRIEKTLSTGHIEYFEYQLPIEGEVHYFESRLAPSSEDEVVAIVRDITKEKRAQELAHGQQEILELIAKGAPLSATLTALARLVERLAEHTLCSILLLNEESGTLRHGAAPSLPDAYTQAIDGVQIGPTVGSCGSAAYHKKNYIATDMETDPNWADFKHLALPHGLRACWSSPILNEENKVLGTFAMYYREPCAPAEPDYKLIETSTALAAIAIERHLAEERLRESEQRYRMLFERNLAGVYRGRLDGTAIDCNEAYAHLFGFASREEFLAHPVVDVYFDAADRQQFLDLLIANGSLTNFEIRLRKKDGAAVWVLLNVTLLASLDGASAILEETAIDITERKLAEEALRQSETKFRNVAESTASAMFIFHGGHLLYVNPATEQITGYTQAELMTMQVTEVIHPDFHGFYYERVEAIQRGSHQPFRAEYKVRHKSGDERWVDITFGDLVSMDDKQVVIGTAFDITDRKQAEKLLIAEKERLAVTLRSIGDGVIATDTDGNIVVLNRVAESLTGWVQEEATGQHLDKVFQIRNAKSRANLESMFAKALLREQVFENQENILLISRDGTERLIAATTAPIYDRRSRIIGVVLVFRDLTEELKRDEEILKATKLESIALLAGGIAHDFNNILTAILGNISLARQYIEPDSKAYQRLKDSEQATLRARDLTQQLLTFASGGAPIKKTASLADLLRESVSFALTGSNIRSRLLLPDDLWLAEVDEGQINQVLHNLVLNARQAMPLGGTIELSAENVTVEEGGFLEGAYLPPQRYVKIAVKDSGVGIAEEHLSKIFDPYFTTKQKGSGLGLATTYSIIKNHGGYIFVESDLGLGTTFSIYFPASENRVAQRDTVPSLSHSGNGRILIMDDEPALRKMISEILKYLGYEAVATQNGEEAIAMYREALTTGQPYDAVILDLTVPGAMGGKETAQELRALDATVKCIVSSGYSNDPVMAQYQENGFVAVIAKPYQIAQLSEVLKQVVGEPSERN